MRNLFTTGLGVAAIAATTMVTLSSPRPAQAQSYCFPSEQLVPGCKCNYRNVGGQMVLVCCCWSTSRAP